MFEKNLFDNFSKVRLNMNILFGITPVIWCTPWNQYFSPNWKYDFYLLSLSELVKSESLFSISSILVLIIINSFFILTRYLRRFIIIAALLVLVDNLLDLLDLDFLSSLCLSLLELVIAFVQCADR